VSGFTNVDVPNPKTLLAVDSGNKPLVQLALKGRKGLPTIQEGRIQAAETRKIAVPSGKTTVVGSTLPNRTGTSGSPVFSSDDHRVVALHAAGDPTSASWQSFEVPMSMILQHVASELRAGRIATDARPLTRQLLARSADKPLSPSK